MLMNRPMRGVAVATGLAVTFSFILAGCDSSSAVTTPATLNPEIEKKTEDMLKNKSQQYNEKFKNKGGRSN